MKRKGTQAGFTVIETLVVLAVTGALFIAIVATFTGSQRKAEFMQATQNLQSRLQQIITDVPNGYYQNMDNIKCTASATGPSLSMGAGNVQGTNEGCVFLGKAIQFQISGKSPEQYSTYSLAGLRSATDFASAKPKVIQAGTTTESDTYDYGLTTKSLKYNGSSIGMFAVVMQMGTLSATGGYDSGNQRVDLIPVAGTALNRDIPTGVSNLETNIVASYANRNPAGGIQLCVQHGNGGQTALYTIGGNGHDLAVKLEVKSCT
jgi:type II secretory pathway pseudopilin PulG